MISLDAARQKAIVVEVLTTAFTNRNFSALDQYFSPDYIQHNPFITASQRWAS
jgi:predicted SnoaL-like aldol condensation-catalyzing enzyme